MTGRIGIAVYAALAYVLFLVTIVWAIGFFVDAFVPTTVDAGVARSRPEAVIIDIGLLGLFAVQHTVMARASFKRRWIKLVPAAAERSTFVLLASAILLLVFWFWQPVAATVWQVTLLQARFALLAVYAVGWMIVFSSTFMIDHFELFGLRQAYAAFTRRAMRPAPFKVAWLYASVRHPMMLGLVIVFWATPRMTAGHLLFAAASTAYILVGIAFEERDLRRQLGEAYREYAKRVPALIPLPVRSGATAHIQADDRAT